MGAIQKNLDKINRDGFMLASLTALPECCAVMGLQFENLVLNNRRNLHRLLQVNPEDIVNDNPFFQHQTTRQAGCQIDYLIQTRFDSLYVCEIKLSRKEIGVEVITEVQMKVAALKRPRGMSCRPVLVHVNGVTDEVIESDYFAHVIDLGGLLS